jgi:hypothetical protein
MEGERDEAVSAENYYVPKRGEYKFRCSVKSLSDKELINRPRTLVNEGQNVILEILLHLAEIDTRELYLPEASVHSRTFEICARRRRPCQANSAE